MKSKFNKNISHSFRFQIVIYSLISMVLTAVTLAVIFVVLLGVTALVQSGEADQSLTDNLSVTSDTLYHAYHNTSETAREETTDALPENAIENTLEEMEENEDMASGAALEIPGNMGPNGEKEPSGLFGVRMPKGVRHMITLLFLFLALFFFIFYFLLLMRKFSAYLEEITEGIKRLATGELRSRIEVRQANELTEIAENINRMAVQLERIVKEERQNEKAKNELITSIAHDLRTPLTSVIGYLELVAEKDLEPETREHYVSVAYRKARRLQKLIDDLFNYTKYGAGELQMNTARIDAVKIMEQLIEEFYPNIQENHLELEVQKNADTAMVEADGMLLARAFGNLLGNAIKYGKDGKNLKIIMETDRTQIRIRVINYGEVIPPEALPNIFERFYRVDASRTEEQGGTGLGLAIAKNIVERHKGTITVQSDLEGTEFLVVLPLAPAIAEEAAYVSNEGESE